MAVATVLTAALPARGQNGAPAITSHLTVDTGWVVAYAGQANAYAYVITATNTPTSFGATGLPGTALFDPSSGVIIVNPSQPGLFQVALSATNADGTGTATLRLAVHPVVAGLSADPGWFGVGDTIRAYATFTGSVVVSGAPRLVAGPIAFQYVSGSGTARLVFEHTVTPSDGTVSLSWPNVIELNGGSIQDPSGLDAYLGFPPPPSGQAWTTTLTSSAFFRSNVLPAGTVGVAYAYPVAAGNAVSYGVTSLPAGLSLDPASGVISGTPAVAGSYAVTLTAQGADGVVAADPVTLQVNPAHASAAVGSNDPGRLINVSVLTSLGGPGQTVTVGFASGGAGTTGVQPLLIRAVGPALAGFGIGSPLPDPIFTLYGGEAALASDDDWGAYAAEVQAAEATTGAFALPDPGSRDAALVTQVDPGSYTVQVSGKGGSGSVLAEIYDATPAYSVSSPRLINLSCLGQVQGGSTLTAGFVVGGSTPCTVLIRAAGPALSAYGVTAPLADPRLILHQTVHGQDSIVASNTGWGGAASLTQTFQAVGAFPFAAGSADSALQVTLPPGTYTAQATSAGGGAGTVLVEVYEAPH